MNKYLNGKIYKLVDNTNGNIYIGSTIRTLDERLKNHVRKYNHYLNEKYSYTSSFDIIKNEDYKIELIENYPCENNQQLIDRETFYIKNIDCINERLNNNFINRNINNEYYEKTRERVRNYKINNREKVLLSKRESYYRHREDILNKIKDYRDLNLDKIKEREKRYRELNKDKISKKGKKTFECICGSILRINEKARHFRTIKHINFMDSITD